MPLIATNNNNMSHDDNDDIDDTVECIQVTITRSPLYGFGLAINDDLNNQSLIVSDVIKNGPADGKILPYDRIVNVNGHPVVRYMEYTALKLIRESTDFVHLIIQRQKHPEIVSVEELPKKFIFSKTSKEENFGIVLDCRYYIKKLSNQTNEVFLNIREDDEVLKINDIPIDRLTLQEAQKLIDKSREQLTLHTIPKDSIPPIVHRPKPLNPNAILPTTGTRCISFHTETSSIGIRLAGGNKYGLFICEIQPNSSACRAGLFIADKIFNVNNIDFTKLTREDAVLCLMNMKSSQVNMIVSNQAREYGQLLSDIGGDSFFIRTHFTYNPSNEEELFIGINDIFHVSDTLYNGRVGHWVATKFNASSSENLSTGPIPNRSQAERLSSTAPNLTELIKSKQPSLKQKLQLKFSDKRLNNGKGDPICWKPMITSKFPAYERVRLKPMTIVRPVVLLGPLADIARDQLLSLYPDQFESPQTHFQDRTTIIKLQSIKSVIEKNRHCLLDITPSAIEQLNYAECYPIVIYFKFANRPLIREIRDASGKLYQKSSRSLLKISEHLEEFYSYLFTSIIQISTSSMNWEDLLKSQIDLQQEQPTWMNYDQLTERDFLKSDEYFVATKFSCPEHLSSEWDEKERSSLRRNASDSTMMKLNKSCSQLGTIKVDEQLSSSDSSGSIGKKFVNKSTMTRAEKDATVNLYATWNKSAVSRPKMIHEKSHPILQKPRVYTYDDRSLPMRGQHLLPSTSGSSLFSLKDNLVGQTRSYSIQDGCHVIGNAHGLMDYHGGKLSCPLTGVSLNIPIGAIPRGLQQEIHFQVCQDHSRTDYSSPAVLCGPRGIKFEKVVELVVPQSATTNVKTILFDHF